MRLCMFHPVDRHMERGWVGCIQGRRVIHLAAQTLQHFFTGGAKAREHAEYPLDDVVLLAPVPSPPAIRVFDDEASFAFANPAAIVGPSETVRGPGESLSALARLAGVVGADGTVAGVSLLLEVRADGLAPPKDRDFGLGLGPVVVTTDELLGHRFDVAVSVDGDERVAVEGADVDWEALRRQAAAGTHLRTGDLLAGPAAGRVDGLRAGMTIRVEAAAIGSLALSLA